MMIQNDKGLSGNGNTFIKNALGGAVKDTAFANNLEKQLSGVVCELFGKMNNKASDVYDILKTNISDSGGGTSLTSAI